MSAVFKGATRPPCLWGIPLKPLMGVSGAVLILGFVFFKPLLLTLPPLLLIMRSMAAEDDQRFRQLYLHLRCNVFGAGRRRYAGITEFRQ
ncbi:MAG: VirB3 family type IV secretion system protein [Succinivibrio sp.]|nr:VirB3 family type IV secretion system protein [Succinivibrio sp.]